MIRRLPRAGILYALTWAVGLGAIGFQKNAPAAQTPLAAAIAAIVESGQQPWLHWPDFSDRREVVRELYETTGFEPLWVRSGKPTEQAVAVLAALAKADERGLSPQDYDVAGLNNAAERLRAAPAPGVTETAGFDTALTVSLLRYIPDAHLGRVRPGAVGFALEQIEKRPFDPVTFVAELHAADDPERLLARLDPQFELFGSLTAALARWRELAGRGDFPSVPELPKLRPGDSHAGVPAVRDYLHLVGELAEVDGKPREPRLYDPELVKAVKSFQQKHALSPDGVIGPATLSHLRASPAGRIRQIELALERLRWLPPPQEEAFVVVNLPEFTLRGYERGSLTPLVQLRAVVGSASLRQETPVLHSTMQYIVFRPFWDVPASIARKEILPAQERDPEYFARHRYVFHRGRVRQLPGSDNALGLIKFVFPNPYHVYMHDTPSKSLFARSRRDFSHGCIRISDAAALAEFALRGQGKWDRVAIETAMKSGKNDRRVYLQRPLGVYLLYSTVMVDDGGAVRFFEDIYRHDARLDSALAKGPPYPYPIRTPTPLPTATSNPTETASPTI